MAINLKRIATIGYWIVDIREPVVFALVSGFDVVTSRCRALAVDYPRASYVTWRPPNRESHRSKAKVITALEPRLTHVNVLTPLIINRFIFNLCLFFLQSWRHVIGRQFLNCTLIVKVCKYITSKEHSNNILLHACYLTISNFSWIAA